MSDAFVRRTHGLPPTSRGIHHLALNTEDMKMTVDFYHGVLGMPLVHAFRVPKGTSRGNPPWENLRHYFFDAGGDTLLAFFELPKGAKGTADRNMVGAMQHCAFTVTEERMQEMVRRLNEAGIEVIGPMEVGLATQSMYFIDPNGIRLEFNCQGGDGGDVRVLQRWTQSKSEIMEDLRTLTEDREWIAGVTGHLPD